MFDSNAQALQRLTIRPSVTAHDVAARALERASDACAALARSIRRRAEVLAARDGGVRRPRARLGPATSVLDRHNVTQAWRIR